jgi:hypothetical protein
MIRSMKRLCLDCDEIAEAKLATEIAAAPHADFAIFAFKRALRRAERAIPLAQRPNIQAQLNYIQQKLGRFEYVHLTDIIHIRDVLRQNKLFDLATSLDDHRRRYTTRKEALGDDPKDVYDFARTHGRIVRHPPKRYADLATALGGIGVFGGAITFTALVALNCNENTIRNLLAYASVLFLGSVVASVPVALALRKTSESENVPDTKLCFVRLQLTFVAGLIVAAIFCLLIVILDLGLPGPFAVGVVIVVASIVLWAPIALMTLRNCCGFLLQALPMVVVLVLCLLAAIDELHIPNHQNLLNPCPDPSPILDLQW